MKKEIFNSLVRIQAQGFEFNWTEPFKPVKDESGIGTGFFINKDGYILTCAHVISSAISISISMPANGKDIFDAKIISCFPEKDIAILKLENKMNTHYLKLGNSDKIISGEDVNAVGYPLGQEKLKITKGIISGREDTLIQTDTPLNPGNSGGPLLNDKDEVIGINSSAFKSEDAENVGFAIPINIFKNLEKDMVVHNSMKLLFQPIIGCIFQNTNSDIMDYYDCKNICSDGIKIQKILPGSSLQCESIKEGDLLCKFDKYNIDNHAECAVDWCIEKVPLGSIIDRYKVGDLVDLQFWSIKDSKIIKKKIKIKSTKDIFKVREMYPLFEKISCEIFGGFIVMNLSLNHMSLENSLLFDFAKAENRVKKNLIISHIYPGSSLSKSDIINSGDIITEINNIKVSDIKSFRESIKKPIRKNNKEYLMIKTKDDKIMILDLNSLINENIFLSNQYQYPITDLNVFMIKRKEKGNKSIKTKKKIIKKSLKLSKKRI